MYCCRLFEVLTAIGKGEEPIDMERMGVVTHKRILESMTAVSVIDVAVFMWEYWCRVPLK